MGARRDDMPVQQRMQLALAVLAPQRAHGVGITGIVSVLERLSERGFLTRVALPERLAAIPYLILILHFNSYR